MNPVKKSRNTVQKSLVLNAVREMRSHVCADEVYSFIAHSYPSISKATVYRNLNLLSQEGLIRKISLPQGSDRYDFTLHDHCHAQCTSCGGVFDVDPEGLGEFARKASVSSGFLFTGFDILLRGICPACQDQN